MGRRMNKQTSIGGPVVAAHVPGISGHLAGPGEDGVAAEY
jgi:hypothetical protein